MYVVYTNDWICGCLCCPILTNCQTAMEIKVTRGESNLQPCYLGIFYTWVQQLIMFSFLFRRGLMPVTKGGPAMADNTMTNQGQPLPTKVNQGQPWSTKVSQGQPWPAMTNRTNHVHQPWPTMANYGKPWSKTNTNHGQ